MIIVLLFRGVSTAYLCGKDPYRRRRLIRDMVHIYVGKTHIGDVDSSGTWSMDHGPMGLGPISSDQSEGCAARRISSLGALGGWVRPGSRVVRRSSSSSESSIFGKNKGKHRFKLNEWAVSREIGENIDLN